MCCNRFQLRVDYITLAMVYFHHYRQRLTVLNHVDCYRKSKLPPRSFPFFDDRWKMEQLWKVVSTISCCMSWLCLVAWSSFSFLILFSPNNNNSIVFIPSFFATGKLLVLLLLLVCYVINKGHTQISQMVPYNDNILSFFLFLLSLIKRGKVGRQL